MRRIVNLLAVVGALSLLGIIGGLMPRWAHDGATGIVLGPTRGPAGQIPVFLDRGNGFIERFVTDSQGRFTLPLSFEEQVRAVWLICAPGGIPVVGRRRRHQIGPTTHGYTPLPVGADWNVRARGWGGPIPGECAGVDSVYRWRYPTESGKPPYAATREEPDWAKYKLR